MRKQRESERTNKPTIRTKKKMTRKIKTENMNRINSSCHDDENDGYDDSVARWSRRWQPDTDATDDGDNNESDLCSRNALRFVRDLAFKQMQMNSVEYNLSILFARAYAHFRIHAQCVGPANVMMPTALTAAQRTRLCLTFAVVRSRAYLYYYRNR